MATAPRFSQLVEQSQGVTCHAWNYNKSQVAFCPNNNELHILEGRAMTDPSTWQLTHNLTEHDLVISSMDWDPHSNRIVTCSHDRNAFVWTQDNADGTTKWKPSLVILRIDKAALDVKWSPDGTKFAVASGAKCVPVCNYEEQNKWWVSKMIKKHKSTVTCLSWHPNSQLLATGSSDLRCRVFSCYVPEVDGPNQQIANFSDNRPFGEDYVEFASNGWVNSVAWSPSGNSLAFCGHDSSIHFASFASNPPAVQVIKTPDLPLFRLMFLSDSCLVGGGHEMVPVLYHNTNMWSQHSKLDSASAGASVVAEEKKSSNSAAARNIFQSKTARGQDAAAQGDKLTTRHENCITCIQNLSPNAAQCTKFSTSGLDGRVVVWDLQALRVDTRALGIAV